MLTTAPLAPPQTAVTRTRRPNRPNRPNQASQPNRPTRASQSRTRWVECSHTLSGLPCMNHQPHAGDGRGCVHYSTSGVPDRHDYGDDE